MRKTIRVFFDSSVIIAGLASSTGSSSMLLILAEMGVIEPYVSEQVVTEVISNIEKKLPASLPQFFILFKTLPFKLVDPDQGTSDYARQLINDKDAPILAAALAGRVDVLVSLDKHFLNVNTAQPLPFAICKPGELLQALIGY